MLANYEKKWNMFCEGLVKYDESDLQKITDWVFEMYAIYELRYNKNEYEAMLYSEGKNIDELVYDGYMTTDMWWEKMEKVYEKYKNDPVQLAAKFNFLIKITFRNGMVFHFDVEYRYKAFEVFWSLEGSQRRYPDQRLESDDTVEIDWENFKNYWEFEIIRVIQKNFEYDIATITRDIDFYQQYTNFTLENIAKAPSTNNPEYYPYKLFNSGGDALQLSSTDQRGLIVSLALNSEQSKKIRKMGVKYGLKPDGLWLGFHYAGPLKDAFSEIYIDIFYIKQRNWHPSPEKMFNEIEGTIRHEYIHYIQSYIKQTKGHFGAMPTKNKPNRSLDHALRDVEFYTRLPDEIYDFLFKWKIFMSTPGMKAVPLLTVYNTARENIKRDFVALVTTKSDFFTKLKTHRPKLWRKAVRIFATELIKEIERIQQS